MDTEVSGDGLPEPGTIMIGKTLRTAYRDKYGQVFYDDPRHHNKRATASQAAKFVPASSNR